MYISIWEVSCKYCYSQSSAAAPEDLPIFAIVPIQRVYFDAGHLPVMACMVQRRSDMLPPTLMHSGELLALPFLPLHSLANFSTSHLTHLGQLNLQLNSTAAVEMMIFEQTFTCGAQINEEFIQHSTTFHRDRKLFDMAVFSSTMSVVSCTRMRSCRDYYGVSFCMASMSVGALWIVIVRQCVQSKLCS